MGVQKLYSLVVHYNAILVNTNRSIEDMYGTARLFFVEEYVREGGDKSDYPAFLLMLHGFVQNRINRDINESLEQEMKKYIEGK